MMKIRTRLLPLSVLVGTVFGGLSATANYQYDNSVFYFNDAEKVSASSSQMPYYESAMQGGLFAMYPTYWRLNADLAYQDPNTVANFTKQYKGSVMGEKLVADYAEEKARQSDYTSVQMVANLIENADASESCAVGLGFNQSNQAERTIAVNGETWLDTQRKPELCDKLGNEMTYNRNISQADRHERLIRMLRIDGRKLSSSRPADDTQSSIMSLASQLGLPITYDMLSNIKYNPNQFFSQFNYSPASQVNQYLYIYAISQLAHRSYSEAIAQLEYDISADNARSQKLLSNMARHYAYRSIAVKRMNMNTDDGFSMRAVEWFRNSLGEPFNQEEAEDYAQASIYFGQWADVQKAITAMTVKNQEQPVWQYWLARSYEAQGNQRLAQSIYKKLAKEIDYYGLLSKDRLGERLTLQDIGGTTLPVANTNQVMSDPHFARAFLLMQNNAKTSYVDREWNWAVRKARESNNTSLTLSAARMAYDQGNYPRMIYAIQNSPNVRNAALSHPTLFSDAVMTYSRQVGIDPAWTYGIIRQESRFQTAARSGAQAQGLMQIIPSTARQIARNLGESVGNMNNPDTNIRYGTWYLSHLAGDSNNQLAVATASYNAGPRAAKAWLPPQGTISADQYVEAIPYGETREYVKHVMENATIYGVALGNPVPITQRMGQVSSTYNGYW